MLYFRFQKVSFSNLTVDYRIIVRSTRTFANTVHGFKQLHEWVNMKKDSELTVHFTMEATGVYYERLAFYLYEQAYTLHVVLPNYANKYAESLVVKSKTDKLDAKCLAQMGLERDLRKWQSISNNLPANVKR